MDKLLESGMKLIKDFFKGKYPDCIVTEIDEMRDAFMIVNPEKNRIAVEVCTRGYNRVDGMDFDFPYEKVEKLKEYAKKECCIPMLAYVVFRDEDCIKSNFVIIRTENIETIANIVVNGKPAYRSFSISKDSNSYRFNITYLWKDKNEAKDMKNRRYLEGDNFL